MVFQLAEVVGSAAVDQLIGASNQVNYGLQGNDTLTSTFFVIPQSFTEPPVFPNILAGGDGDDIYQLVANSFNIVAELGRSGTDTVVLQGLSFASATIEEYTGRSGGKHLIIYGPNFVPTTIVTDWKEVENFQFTDVTHTAASLDALVPDATQTFAQAYGIAASLFNLTTVEIEDTFDAVRGSNNVLHGTPPPSGATENADTLTGTSGAEFIKGLGGNDSITGLDGNDTVNGNVGADTIKGGNGDDSLMGGMDNDQLFGNAGNDTLKGDVGNDSIRGGQGNDQLRGNIGNDTLKGDKGADTIRGGGSDDSIEGGEGADVIFGDLGNDTLTGNTGVDTFAFEANSGVDTITDFVSGTDKIQILASVIATPAAAVAAFNAGVLDLGGGNSVTLTGVSAVVEADFVIVP